MIFHYKAVEQSGKILNDLMAAVSQKEVVETLKGQGLTVLEVRSEEEWLKRHRIFSLSDIRIGSKVTLLEKISFARHLAIMITAGLALAEGLDILSSDTKSSKFKKILEEAKYGLESGRTLSSSLAQYPEIFDKSFINMLRAGEASGKLSEVLEHIAKKLQQDYDLISKVRAAMTYPAVVLSALILIGAGMLVFVVPKIADVFVRMKVAIPWPTQVLLFISKIFVAKPWISLPIIILGILILIFFLRTLTGKRFLSWLIHGLPVLKKLALQMDLARLSHSFSLLLKSGVPITSALELTADTISKEKLKQAVLGFKRKVADGVPLADCFRQEQSLFPLIMTRMIAVGEKTGKLDQILDELADFYRKETEQTLQTIASLVEPILMFLIGVAIGAMVLAIIGPMYQVVQQISQ